MPSGTTEISAATARTLRLHTQGLAGPATTAGPAGPAPVDVVRRMVALQGQDLPAVLRAIAIRSRTGTTIEDVRAAFDAGELVRGWTQRGTLFATTPGDLAALVSLTGERVDRMSRRTRETFGLDDEVTAHAEAVARAALTGPGAGRGISRAAMVARWREAGVPVDGQRGYHLIVALALRGLLHWGPFDGAQQLMVATPDAARPDAGSAPADEQDVLRRIARSYFASRGPATTDDLAWWLGLPKRPVRAAVTALREAEPDALVEVTVDGRAMLLAREALDDGASSVPGTPACVVLVPGFDEIVLGYQDRELVADTESMGLVVPFSNGTFRPAILMDGRLVGTWRRAPKPDQEPFELIAGLDARTHEAVAAAVAGWRLD